MNNKTVIVAPAIKTKFWQRIYKNFCRNKTPFHFVFVGDVAPNFSLPDNFTHINCSLGPAACAEVAYRYAYKHITDAKYIINTADDVDTPEYFLDSLIGFYEKKIIELGNDYQIVSTMANGCFEEENLMAFYQGGPVLLGQMLTTIENSKRIGGIDRRFNAIYWDCDRHLRAHQDGANVLFAGAHELTPSSEFDYNPTAGLWKRHSGHDYGFLKELWDIKDGGDQEVFCAELQPVNGRPTNIMSRKKLQIKRLDKVIEYDDFYLRKYYE